MFAKYLLVQCRESFAIETDKKKKKKKKKNTKESGIPHTRMSRELLSTHCTRIENAVLVVGFVVSLERPRKKHLPAQGALNTVLIVV